MKLKSLNNQSIIILSSLFVAFFSIINLNKIIDIDTDFSKMGLLGSETVYSQIGNENNHCETFAHKSGNPNSPSIESCIDYGLKNNKNILWLGNSQLNGVNQYVDGQLSAPAYLSNEFIDYQENLVIISPPNSSLQEHYLLFEYISNSISLDTVILPLIFDDTREDGIRYSLRKGFSDQKTISDLQASDIGKYLVRKNDKQQINHSSQKYKSLQSISENFLDSKASLSFESWNLRDQYRSNISSMLYRLRNYIFDIKPTDVRKIIRGRYDRNLDSFSSILLSAEKKNINVIVYIAPIRNDIRIPYDLNEYSDFKEAVEKISSFYNVNFINLEKLIPNELWGLKSATTLGGEPEVDFMHFQDEGHKILAKRINDELLKNDFIKINNQESDKE